MGFDGNLLNAVRYQDPDPISLQQTFAPDKERPQVRAPSPDSVIKEIRITGNSRLPTHHVLRKIRSREGRLFDPDLLQQDVDQLWQAREIRRINGPFIDRQPDGVVVTIDVVERLYIDNIQFVGNRAMGDRRLKKESGLSEGDPLDLHEVRMAKTRIEELYQQKGFANTQVSIVEGDEADDRSVIFLVHEDQQEKVLKVQFEGNTIASDARLRNLVKVKPGILWLIGGNLNRREIEQDMLRLTSYYRNLGFFNARIGRELIDNKFNNWVTIRYVVNEGPRYKVRNVSFIGNRKFSSEQLATIIKLRSDDGQAPEFDATKMNYDRTALEDLYGSQGHVFARIQAEPRFLETPGQLDLVYNIEEGEQYRVGKINIILDGDYSATKRQTILNRMGLRSGDVFDTREIKATEARLMRSQLFADGTSATGGAAPRLAIRLPEGLDEPTRYR